MAYGINVYNDNGSIQIDGTLANSTIVASGTLSGTSVSYGQTYTITYSNYGYVPEIYISVTMNAQAAGLVGSYWIVDSIDFTSCTIRREGSTSLAAQEQVTYAVIVRNTSGAPTSGYGISIYSDTSSLVYATNRSVQAIVTATATIPVPRGTGAGAPTTVTNINIPTSYSGLQYFFVNPVRLGNWVNQDGSFYTIKMRRNSTYQYEIRLESASFAVSTTNVSQQLVFPCVTIV